MGINGVTDGFLINLNDQKVKINDFIELVDATRVEKNCNKCQKK